MRTNLLAALTALALLGAAAQEAVEPGDEVVLASPSDALKIGKRVVATGAVHRVYTVGRVNGEWLWLEAADVAGWIKADRVLPFDLALKRATGRVESGEEPVEALNERGLLWADRGRSDLAEADFSTAIEQAPGWYLLYLNRALARRAAGRYEEALEDLSRAGSLHVLDPLISYNRGLVQLDLGRPEAAYEAFSVALLPNLAPNHAGARFNRAALGLVLGREGAADDAEIYLAIAGWNESLSPYAAIIAAIDHRRAGRMARADGLLAAAAAKIADDPWPGPILAFLRGEKTAAEAMSLAVTSAERAEAAAYLGAELARRGEVQEARRLLDDAAPSVDPGSVPTYLAKAVRATRRGRDRRRRRPAVMQGLCPPDARGWRRSGDSPYYRPRRNQGGAGRGRRSASAGGIDPRSGDGQSGLAGQEATGAGP